MARDFASTVLCAGLALAGMPAAAQDAAVESEQATFRIVTVARGLDNPWGLAFLPDGRMLVTEKPGNLRLVTPEGRVSEPLGGLPAVVDAGQGGLLDVALHPDFAANNLVYLTYSGPGEGGSSTELARGRLTDEGLIGVEVLFRAEPKIGSAKHFGSRIAFARDGTVLVSLGERGRREGAQDPTNHLGAIVRLNDDGSVPTDNPFADGGGLVEIFSTGHRNVQGMAQNPESGKVWAHEHGPKGGDEVNILLSGANYGWPVITYGIDYSGTPISEETHREGMEQPVLYWDPSIAPSGMAFYEGDAFPEWRGDLFVGALVGRHLRRIELDGKRAVGQEVLLADLGERIRDVRMGPDGFLYLLTDGDDATLIRLEPAE